LWTRDTGDTGAPAPNSFLAGREGGARAAGAAAHATEGGRRLAPRARTRGRGLSYAGRARALRYSPHLHAWGTRGAAHGRGIAPGVGTSRRRQRKAVRPPLACKHGVNAAI